MSTTTSNAIKRLPILEHLVKNPVCGNSCSEMRLKLLRSCTNIFDLVKIEAIYIHLNKPKLCKQKELDYLLTLFSLTTFVFFLLHIYLLHLFNYVLFVVFV